MVTVLFLWSAVGVMAPGENLFPFVIPTLDATPTVVDVSHLLDKPAGAHGFVRVEEGHFVDGRGRRLRFLGTNLTFGGAFPPKELAPQIAARMAKFGLNCVRFHHLDGRRAPQGIWRADDPTQFDPEQLDKLDFLIYQLKQQGIYTNLNLHVSRNYPGFPDFDQLPRYGKGVDNFEPRMIQMQKDYARALLTHQNPYTGNRYVDEPAVAIVELNNENSLLRYAFGRTLQNLPEYYRRQLEARWREWLRAKYETTESLRTAWGDTSLPPEQSLERGNLGLPGANAPEAQRRDFLAFIAEKERAYAQEMYRYLKEELGLQALVIDTQASYGGLGGAYREWHLDFADNHAYWEHPRFPGRPWDPGNWYIPNTSMVSALGRDTLTSRALYRLAERPYTISEYNHPAPNHYSAECLPLLAAFAALQDWDGIFIFNYHNQPDDWDRDCIRGYFSVDSHPGKMAFFPAAAMMFLRGDVRPAEMEVRLSVPEGRIVEQLLRYGNRVEPVWAEAGVARLGAVRHRLALEFVPGDGDIRASAFVGTPGPQVASDTGEIAWDATDPAAALFTVNAPASKAVVGFLGGRAVTLGPVTIRMEPTGRNWAALTLTAMDGKPVEESERLLLVAVGKVENTDMGWNEEHTSVGRNWGTGPTRCEGIPAQITLRTKVDLEVYALDGRGFRTQALRGERTDDALTFTIGPQWQTIWYEAVARQGAQSP